MLRKGVRLYAGLCAVFLTLFVFWMILGLPILIDRICIRSEAPAEAEYIVCLGAGLTTGNLPTDVGWERVYTAVQLYLDGYGRKIIFTGGGAGKVSETEVYAEVARWLGMAGEDAVFEPGAGRTSDHPKYILRITDEKIEKTTPLDIVTSLLHSKRAALCFKKAGFENFRLVTRYEATGTRMVDGRIVSRANAGLYLRGRKKSTLPAFKPNNKVYKDVFIRSRWGLAYFFTTLRELAALVVYKVKGYI